MVASQQLYPPCTDDDYYADVRDVLEEYGQLLELQMNRVLDREDRKRIAELRDYLLWKDIEAWGDADPLIVDMITSRAEIEFPMLRHTLHLLFNNE